MAIIYNGVLCAVYSDHLLIIHSYVGRTNLTEVYLVGVGDALSTHSAAEAKGIKAHFRMDESGLLLLDNVESLFEYPPEEEEQSTLSSEAHQDCRIFSESHINVVGTVLSDRASTY